MTYNKTVSLSVESSDLPLCDESTACEILLVTTHTCSTYQWIHMQRVVFYADNRVYVSISHRVLHKPVTQAYIHVHVCNSTEWSRAHSDTRLVILQPPLRHIDFLWWNEILGRSVQSRGSYWSENHMYGDFARIFNRSDPPHVSNAQSM